MRIGRINAGEIRRLAKTAGVRRQVRIVAHAVESAAERRAPVRTGTLRSALTAQEQPNGDYHVGWDTAIADYGPHVELGTVDTPAQPHLRPAAAEVKRSRT